MVIGPLLCTIVSSQTAISQPSETVSKGGARLLSIRLLPQDVTLNGVKATQRFLVLGRYADGLERDVSPQTNYSISDTRLGRIDEGGRVVAVGDGRFVLRAQFGGQVAQTDILVEGSRETRPFSFSRDVGTVFTRRGCNDSGCHGGVKGQGGFKLSLNGLYPQEDYKWIVEGGTYQVLTSVSSGPKNPRINLKEPEQSLLLLKPTLSIPHGGGKRFSLDSADYATLIEWIRRGAPYGEDTERGGAKVERLEIFPREGVLDLKGRHQLLVTAFLSDGRRRDVTDQAYYTSNNPEVAKVTSEGIVEAVRAGETTVIVRAAGLAAVAIFAVIDKPIPNYPEVVRNNFIDDQVFAKLRKFNLIPSELSSDGEFLRRVCLDLTGTLPPPDRVREFVSSKDPRKRQKLIEILLSSPEYVDYWTFRFADLFRVSFWANAHSSKDSQAYWEWIRSGVAGNRPYDQTARELIAALGDSAPTKHYLPNGDPREPELKMAEAVRVFMGRRLDCAQCHNHPYEAWSQDQFWGMAAFFGRMNLIGIGEIGGGENNDILGAIYEDPAGQEVETGEQLEARKVIHPRTKQEVHAQFLDGRVLPEEAASDPRRKLGEWMTSHPYFAEATVNRIWSYFFGRGIVDPVDDFRVANPPTHPSLLKALAEDFKNHQHDLKHLVRLIVQSRTYQLTSKPNATNSGDEINYSHALPRPLDAEVLSDAISEVTGVPETFEHSNDEMAGTLPPGTRAINIKEPDSYASRLLDLYGRANRHVVPDRPTKATLAQALHMLAGYTYTDKLSGKGGRIEKLLSKGATNREIIEELYLAALSRFPTETEQVELEKLFGQQGSRPEAIENLLWAVISSREFATNH